MRGDLVEIRLRDFDVIAEHGIEPDFNEVMPVRSISCCWSFAIQSLPAARRIAEFIERRIEAVADHAPLLHGERRVIHDGARNQLHEVGDSAS